MMIYEVYNNGDLVNFLSNHLKKVLSEQEIGDKDLNDPEQLAEFIDSDFYCSGINLEQIGMKEYGLIEREGDGQLCHSVYGITDGDRELKFAVSYYYSSWDSNTYRGVCLVSEKVVTKTVYEIVQ